jgi:hypothetical protein
MHGFRLAAGEISTIMMIKNSKIGLVRPSKVIYSFIVISIFAVESLETQKERMGCECSLLSAEDQSDGKVE